MGSNFLPLWADNCGIGDFRHPGGQTRLRLVVAGLARSKQYRFLGEVVCLGDRVVVSRLDNQASPSNSLEKRHDVN
jgi:hypothetical protein